MSAPGRDPAHMLKLFAEKLAGIDAGFGIDVITLEAVEVAPMPGTQTTFARAHLRARTDPSGLIDRLSNRLGPERVVRLIPIESHIPERARAARVRARTCQAAPHSAPTPGARAHAATVPAGAAGADRRRGRDPGRPARPLRLAPPRAPHRAQRGARAYRAGMVAGGRTATDQTRATTTGSRTTPAPATGCSAPAATARRTRRPRPPGSCTGFLVERMGRGGEHDDEL